MYLCRELTDLSLPKIGQQFGGRDHTTVMNAERRIRKDLAERRNVYNRSPSSPRGSSSRPSRPEHDPAVSARPAFVVRATAGTTCGRPVAPTAPPRPPADHTPGSRVHGTIHSPCGPETVGDLR